MCSCNSKSKISGMKTKNLMSSLVSGALAGGGAIASQELGAMVPATIDPLYVNIAKIALGSIAPALVKGKNAEYLKSIGTGVAVEGALALYATYKTPAVSGWDNSNYAMSGLDNSQFAMSGLSNEQNSTVATA